MVNKIFIKCFFAILIFCIFLSCNKFEFNPYQVNNSVRPSNLNAKNIENLLSGESTSDDTVTILFTGDSQRFYERLDDLVKKVNEYSNVDFLLLNGDISNYGLLEEFLWVQERLEKLHIPHICIIGNHDLTSNGSDIYTEMFGPKNFTFTYKNYKFLCHDDNSRAYNYQGNVPDLHWLSNELNDSSAKWFIGASHVPPWDPFFDQNIMHDYLNLFGSKQGFILSLHGHAGNGARYFNNDSVLYININSSPQWDDCYLLKLINGKVIYQMIQF
jgi:3',5'-cyclic-AMP phosphodiesterase